jgi:hypothetical protein
MKKFEVAVPLKQCNNVRIEPSEELGELMVVYTFPLNGVYLRGLVENLKDDLYNKRGV